MALRLVSDLFSLLALTARPRRSIEAENRVLRRELALFKERGVKPRRIDAATRLSLAWLSRLCDWRSCVIVVRPETVVRWHRAGWRLFWRYKSRPGRPSIPVELRQLIRRMATENPLWGEERIANELLVKLGIRVSPRTVRKYMPVRPLGHPRGDQRWSTFLRNHATAILACDFFVAVTATFRMLYVRVDRAQHPSPSTYQCDNESERRLDPTAVAGSRGEWRRASLPDTRSRSDLRQAPRRFDQSPGVEVLRSPVASPKANSLCERVIGTARRECLDWLIAVSEAHLRAILKCWVTHYNSGRPHSALGPGEPDPPRKHRIAPKPEARHHLAADALVLAKSVLGGLLHEYSVVNVQSSA